MNLLLFGAPGTGKGTQSTFLISHYKLYHISTGDLFRKALNKKTPLGVKVQSFINMGKLVPDSIVVSLIKEVLTSKQKSKETLVRQSLPGFILDGFPRTLPQAESLDNLLMSLNLKLNTVLLLNVPQPVLIKRVTGRRVAEKSGLVYHIEFNPPKKNGFCDKSGEPLIHRKDDQKEVIKERLKTYHEQTFPLIEYYRKKGILWEVDGQGSPKKVFSRIQQILSPLAVN